MSHTGYLRDQAAKRHLQYFDSSHRYKLDGRWVPSVTTILGVLDKPGLPRWSARLVAEYVADHPDGIEELRAMGRGPMVDALKGMPWQERDKAGDRGTILHAYAEELVHGREVDVAPEHVAVMESALSFMEHWHIYPLVIEFPCASREHEWAGTGDLIAGYTRPDTGHHGVGIFDWKSGKDLYPEFAWQLNAYAHAEFHGLDGDEQPIPPCDDAFGVQISEEGYTVKPFAFGRNIYEEFIQIRRTFAIAKRGRGDWKIPGSGYVGLPILAPDGAA